ncbi:hypothetical protein LTR62_005894 [Meristemomyces frigidus]|uniref:SMP domain-containing protein n=1 Tax=Meristemomyces frigidus TaxID=1508187 RepID=A0AAN7YMR8_9PEZI|nr:hypothetical protein LTR62_005894 [Meristemomyces frigidus]
MPGDTKMTSTDASRIQSSYAKSGNDPGFASRAQSAGDKNANAAAAQSGGAKSGGIAGAKGSGKK